MSSDQVVAAFRENVCAQVQIAPEDLDCYRVAMPFEFDDGDRLVIVLKRVEGGCLLTDEAHTLMRLTYDLDEDDLRRSTRQKLVANALAMGGVDGRDGELVLRFATTGSATHSSPSHRRFCGSPTSRSSPASPSDACSRTISVLSRGA